MISNEGEQVSFLQPLSMKAQVEEWFLAIARGMTETVADQLLLCLRAYSEMERESWLGSFPAQCVQCVEQMIWAYNINQALEAIEVT